MLPVLVALPWLHGIDHVQVTREGNPEVASRMTQSEPDPSCVASEYPGLELHADVYPAGGQETVLATYTQGIEIHGSEDELLGAAPGFTCEGSADDLELLASGTVFLEPTIVLAITSGGRREQSTWIALYRPGEGGRLDPLFTATVEEREGDRVHRGDITFVPGGLLYRRPGGGTSVWIYDPVARAYVPRGPSEPPERVGLSTPPDEH